jgi:DNA gyrase subunit A
VEGGDELVAQRGTAQRQTAGAQRQQALASLGSDSRLVLQADGILRIVTPQVLGRLRLHEPQAWSSPGVAARLILPVQPPPLLLAFTNTGRMALLRWEFAAQQAAAIERFLPDSLEGSGERIIDVVQLPADEGQDLSLALLSSDGRIKRLAGSESRDLSGRAVSVLKLKDGVALERVVCCRPGDDLLVASSTGRLLRLPIDDATVPLMGRSAQGPTLMRRLPGETIVGAAAAPPHGTVLLVSAMGRLKRLAVAGLRHCQRGDLGEIGLRFSDRQDRLVDLRSDNGGLLTVETGGGCLRLDGSTLAIEDGRGAGTALELPAGETVQRLLPLLVDGSGI